MSTIQVNEQVLQTKKHLQKIASELIDASTKFGLDKDTREILERQVEHINDNFLFVVTGEVNAGKSSFINALLQAHVSETSHEICTSKIQKIIYGESEQVIDDEKTEVQIREYPTEILKQITIVDTPGTNSKAIDHQIITERFIPHANLIMFVFMTENIHAESAWTLFREIKDKWGKKVVFVQTKKDMYTSEQIDGYKNTLRKYVQNEGIENPVIFSTSARLDEQGDTELSGFNELRTYINDEVLDHAAEDKLKDDFNTLKAINNQLSNEFSIRKQKYEQDQAVRDKISLIIAQQEDNVKESIDELTQQCVQAYDKNSDIYLKSLSKEIGFFNLTLRSVRSVFGGESTKKVLEQLNKDFATNLNRDMNQIVENGTDSVKNDIQYMLTQVKNELDRLNESQTKGTKMFSGLDTQRSEIIYNLKHNLTNFIEKSNVFTGQSILSNDIDYSGANIAGGAAAIGATVAMIAQHSVLDVTGGIVTGLALLVAGGLATFQKSKYMSEAKETIKDNRDKLFAELEGQLMAYFNDIKENISKQFFEFDQALKTERIQIQNFDEVSSTINQELIAVEQEIS